ncbi:hypothetical protein C8J56DRAFT_793302 [Mycena floridula]|nr:hypothetical protein C8J56DRAFT_793302 [Mycena floridula]
MSAPLKAPRVVALSLSCAWGIIALGIAISARIKSNHEKAHIQDLVKPAMAVIDTDDVTQTGIVIATASGIIALLSFIYLIIPKFGSRRSLLLFQTATLSFCAMWLLGTQIAFTLFYSTRGAKVQGFLGGVALPDQVVQGIQAKIGADPMYKHKHYLELLAILPWFTFAFTLIAAIVTFIAHARVKKNGF